MRYEGHELSKKFPASDVADDVVIDADDIVILEGARLERGVQIAARTVRIGWGTRLERGTEVRGIGEMMDEFSVGDQSFIGYSNRILAPRFSMGDYSQLHNSGLHSGYRALTLGHNCWIGQNTILNCTERLNIGNNVRIGTQSQLWTHVASGELLEGCTLFGSTPLTLEDNVWIVGGAVVSPGLTLGRNSIIMTGAVVTRSTEPFHTYAGVPAKDVTGKLSFWREVDMTEKLAMARRFADEFLASMPQHAGKIHVVEDLNVHGLKQGGEIVITSGFQQWATACSAGISVFDLSSKQYLKRRTPIEAEWMKFITSYRARFVPLAST